MNDVVSSDEENESTLDNTLPAEAIK